MKKLFLFFSLLVFNSKIINAQTCTGCSTIINQTDTSEYIVSLGQKLCIDSMGNIFGKVTLNGGIICNKGFFNPKELIVNSGTINNSGNLTLLFSLTLPSSSALTISESSVININGDLIMNSSNVINYGFINITGNVQNNNSVLINYNVINCNETSGGAITNSGIINEN
ncbi:MAG: hypothetical protein ABIP51_17825 [Bacteroidia bacterium]